ncbi:MAG: hypothetical protein ACR2J3_10245 [Aridibacter sp.]
MEIHLKIIGLLMLGLALVHIIFPKYFEWTKELGSVILINNQMMYVHTFFVAMVLFLMGILCLTSSNELVETNLGKKIAFGFAVFWLIRLLIQFFGYSSELWKGKRFETSVHIVFSILWTYFSVIFFLIFWNS